MQRKEKTGFSIDWDIDISALAVLLHKDYISYNFYLPTLSETKWCLYLFQTYKKGTTYLTTRLQRAKEDNGPSEIKIEAAICYGLNNERSFKSIVEFEKFIYRNDESETVVLNTLMAIERSFILDDFLSIRFGLWSQNSSSPFPAKHMVVSTTVNRKFVWHLKDFSFMQHKHSIKHVLSKMDEEDPELTIELCMNGKENSSEAITARISSDKVNCLLTCAVSVLNHVGDNIVCDQIKSHHNFEKDGNVWLLPNLITKLQLVEMSKELFPDDILSLEFVIMNLSHASVVRTVLQTSREDTYTGVARKPYAVPRKLKTATENVEAVTSCAVRAMVKTVAWDTEAVPSTINKMLQIVAENVDTGAI